MRIRATFPFRTPDELGQPTGDYVKVDDVIEVDDDFGRRKIEDRHAIEELTNEQRAERNRRDTAEIKTENASS